MDKFFLLTTAAFNNGSAGWKLDDDGKVVLKDGNPVYVDNSGREMVVEQNTIKRLNDEARDYREKREKAESELKKFEGIDPEIARKAVETVSKLDAKKLIDAGEVDRVREEIKNQFTPQITEKDKVIQTLQQQIDNMQIGSVFASSEFLRESINVPRDMFEASFRNNFKVEDGKVVAYDKAGNRLMSKTRSGEYADAEEALRLLVESHPQKDTILKAEVGAGTGNNGGGGNRPGSRNIKRGEFEKLPQTKKNEILGKVRDGEMSLTD